MPVSIHGVFTITCFCDMTCIHCNQVTRSSIQLPSCSLDIFPALYRYDVSCHGVLENDTRIEFPSSKMANKDLKRSLLLLYVQLITAYFCLKLNERTFCTCGKQAYPNKPFIAVWNSPTGGCNANFSVPIELKRWDILADPLQRWDSHYVTVFYGSQLGLYPYFTTDDGRESYNGGLPQVNLINRFNDCLLINVLIFN